MARSAAVAVPDGRGGARAGTDGADRRRWLRPRRILAILAILVALAVLAAVAVYFSVNSKLTKADVLVPTSLTSAGTNWLITGSDSRAGLTRQQENQLALGHDITGSRSDTIMLLHVPANGTRPTLVSLPRDSYVHIPGHGYNKLNAAYDFGGPKLLIATVQDATGLPINHFMGIGFGGLVSVVNDVGGVQMCLKAPMKDPKAGLNLKAGCQVLNGDQALGFVRTRAFAEGDLQREQDQRVLIKGILSKMTSAGTLANPFAIVPAANGAASAITIDQGTGLNQLISVAFALRNPVTTTVPYRPVREHERRVGRRVEHHGGEAVLQRPRPRPGAAEEPHHGFDRPGHRLRARTAGLDSPASQRPPAPPGLRSEERATREGGASRAARRRAGRQSTSDGGRRRLKGGPAASGKTEHVCRSGCWVVVLTRSAHIGPCIDLHEPSWD